MNRYGSRPLDLSQSRVGKSLRLSSTLSDATFADAAEAATSVATRSPIRSSFSCSARTSSLSSSILVRADGGAARAPSRLEPGFRCVTFAAAGGFSADGPVDLGQRTSGATATGGAGSPAGITAGVVAAAAGPRALPAAPRSCSLGGRNGRREPLVCRLCMPDLWSVDPTAGLPAKRRCSLAGRSGPDKSSGSAACRGGGLWSGPASRPTDSAGRGSSLSS